jgi:hypothetical protein
MLHGRLLGGLAAWAIERDHGDEGFVPARLTVDLFKSPAMALTTIETEVVRAGGRVRAVDARLQVAGQDVARASTLWLRRTDGEAAGADEHDLPGTAHWSVPPPDEMPALEAAAEMSFDVRPIGDRGFGAAGPEPRRAWLRDRRALVDGQPLSPFVRVALCADFASPFANSHPDGLDYINADFTLHLARLPEGEWIGIETDDRVAASGVSVVQCVYFDQRGPIGWSSACAVLTARLAMDR